MNPDNPAYVANNTFRDGGLRDSPVITLPAEQAAEQGKFRTPTLRNVELTAPYMQDFFKLREFEPFGITFYPAGTLGIQVRTRDEVG